jgi:hypothetical protein
MMHGDPNVIALLSVPDKKHELRRAPVQTTVAVQNEDCSQARVY